MAELLSAFHEAVACLDIPQVLELIPQVSVGDDRDTSLYHSIVGTLCMQPNLHNEATRLIYLLHNYGYHVNHEDETGSTALLFYMQNSDFLDEDVLMAFLRCNADVFQQNQSGECAFDESRKSSVSRSVQVLFAKFLPGIWKAVLCDDVAAVRCLINQWCHVCVEKDGKSLLQLALEKGTEEVIRVISGIRPCMELAHGVLAGDVNSVKKVIERGGNLNINVKNMGSGGTTPIYYAAIQNNTEMIDVLLSHGAKVYYTMTLNGVDMPIYFALLKEHNCWTETLIKLIPTQPVHVEALHCQGRNVLFHSVDCDADPMLVAAILNTSSAFLVTATERHGLTAQDYAIRHGCLGIAAEIDKFVSECWLGDRNPSNRRILGMHNYRHLPQLPTIGATCSQTNGENSNRPFTQEDFEQYKEVIEEFHAAVEAGNANKVASLLNYKHCSHLEVSLADCRSIKNNQPILHKAVLRKNIVITKLLAETFAYKQKRRLDTIRDQFFRTALHYAYGMEDSSKELVEILIDHGASEFSMDKDGHSPLLFKDRRALPEMQSLLEYHLNQNYNEEEPDPWSVPLPIPIVGYLMNCAHSHHRKLSSNFINKLQLKSSQGDLTTSSKSLNDMRLTKVKPFRSADNLRSDSVLSVNNKKHKLSKSDRPLTIGGCSELKTSTEIFTYHDEIKDFLTGMRPASRKNSFYITGQDSVSIIEDEAEFIDTDLDNDMMKFDMTNGRRKKKKNKRLSKANCVIV